MSGRNKKTNNDGEAKPSYTTTVPRTWARPHPPLPTASSATPADSCHESWQQTGLRARSRAASQLDLAVPACRRQSRAITAGSSKMSVSHVITAFSHNAPVRELSGGVL